MKNRALFAVIFGLLLAGLAFGQPNAVPGSAHSIAFHSNRDGLNQIYVMNPDGSDQSRLSNSSFSDQFPDISPDETQIAFSSNREDGHFEIWVMNSDGSGATRLTHTPSTIANSWPRWSPSGEWIAFQSGAGTNFQIWLVKPDSTGLTQATTYNGLNQFPEWSPDGTRLNIRRDNNLYLINLDMNLQEASAVQLTDTPGFINQMGAFSPDGTKIAYMSTRLGNNPTVFVRSVDGGVAGDSQAVILAPNANGTSASDWTSRAPSWSPNSQYIYFTGLRPETNKIEQLFVRRTDGSEPTQQLTTLGANVAAAVRHVVAPTIMSAVASPSVLWPPDNKLVPVSLTVNVSDLSDSSPVCQITDVASSEPIAGGGWQITGPLTLNLLAQRFGSGTGRQYTIAVICTNSSQMSSSTTVTVFVPHDQGR